ncbi:tetraspanin-7-like isoform X2 [Aethina tumida]|uniref:tetraspanin-7-like isoform X2 n=1 Tax=Aethina tumida TaxID=116153 RepID=UPI0021485076|nr:tetraspanin-7-like isoform X2 [Aethina tumida]
MGCSHTALKIINGIIAAFFGIVGLGFILFGGFGTFLLSLVHHVNTLEKELLTVPSIVFTLVGIILLFFVIFGCCAVCRESPCCIETYSVVLILLAILQIAMGGYLIYKYENVNYIANLNQVIGADLNRMNDLDVVQDWLSCCGRESKDEYDDSTIPKTCCDENLEFCTKSRAHNEGCHDALLEITFFFNYYIAWISIVVGITELIGAIFGFCVSCGVWRKQSLSWA